ncbi:hypothetical protein FEM03_07155 [Phragmitibacter flavus]|uniref:Uncharacterized protein n=1 Tax=Phragmitibacter flavus TaxID=2576071 RepID=A0A5R8KGE2_9BACT|nr:hypothetical protein [Phragmitibacter flavus]TLD71301.1 hypothetical protein FEM03_07155 [Phragmitibacter flavus]
MNSTTNSAAASPEWLYHFEERLHDFTPSFPDILDGVVFEQLVADALVFRVVLTLNERQWVLERLAQGVALLHDWQHDSRRRSANSLRALSLLPPLSSAVDTSAAYGIANRLIQLAVRLMEHPNYISEIGQDLGLLCRDSFLPAA